MQCRRAVLQRSSEEQLIGRRRTAGGRLGQNLRRCRVDPGGLPRPQAVNVCRQYLARRIQHDRKVHPLILDHGLGHRHPADLTVYDNRCLKAIGTNEGEQSGQGSLAEVEDRTGRSGREIQPPGHTNRVFTSQCIGG